MSTSTALRPSVRAAFTALIDYAGLFPPAQLPLQQASDEYRKERTGPYAWMLGRFIAPVTLLAAPETRCDAPFSAIVRGADEVSTVAALRRDAARIETLEFSPHPDPIERLRERLDAEGLGDLPAYVEIARGADWFATLDSTMGRLQARRLGAKLRCGGLTAGAFPSVRDVAFFIAAARSKNVPFKATAGLHHPVRHRDRATGFTQHGFLNLLAAAALAPRVNGKTLEQIVAEEDPGAFAFDDDTFSWRAERIDVADLERSRKEGFVAYGSCSFSEPVEDLIALGVLPPR
jgi:hypothetical protein